MNNIAIKSTHTSLTDAIEAAGGLNREFNPTTFDKEVARTTKDAIGNDFKVIEYCGRLEVVYTYQCDIRLLNAFNPFGGGLSSSATIGWVEGDEIVNVKSIPNSKSNRKIIASVQKDAPTFFVLNF